MIIYTKIATCTHKQMKSPTILCLVGLLLLPYCIPFSRSVPALMSSGVLKHYLYPNCIYLSGGVSPIVEKLPPCEQIELLPCYW